MRVKLQYSKIRLDSDSFLRKLDPQKFLQQEALNVRARIVADTTAGKKADGGGLKPYAAGYKDQIDSGSIAGKSPGSHTPNLTATGTLLRSLQVRPITDGAEVAFEGTHPPARKVSKRGAAKKVKDAVLLALAENKNLDLIRTQVRGGKLIRTIGGGHVRASRTEAQRAERAQKAKSARMQAKQRATMPGIGSRRLTRADRGLGPGGDVANAVIAKAQYDMGRDGWFSISEKDIAGIMARWKKRMDEALKNLVALK